MKKKILSGRLEQTKNIKNLWPLSVSGVLILVFVLPFFLSAEKTSLAIKKDAQYYPGKGEDWETKKPEVKTAKTVWRTPYWFCRIGENQRVTYPLKKLKTLTMGPEFDWLTQGVWRYLARKLILRLGHYEHFLGVGEFRFA